MRKSSSFSLICGAMLALATVSTAHAQKLVAAWSSVSAVNSPLWIMNDAGFFKRRARRRSHFCIQLAHGGSKRHWPVKWRCQERTAKW